MDVEEIQRRYRIVGGVLRHIFANETEFKDAISELYRALYKLSEGEARDIAYGKNQNLNTLDSEQPKSALMGYVLKSATFLDDDLDYINTFNDLKSEDFRQSRTVAISPFVAERIYSKFMKDLWQIVLSLDVDGWRIFEAYCRWLMAGDQPIKLETRECVGKRDADYKNIEPIILGGCKEIRLPFNIVEAANNESMTVFQSTQRCHELIDFIYKDEFNHFHAFQVTVGDTHKAEVETIKKLVEMISHLTTKNGTEVKKINDHQDDDFEGVEGRNETNRDFERGTEALVEKQKSKEKNKNDFKIFKIFDVCYFTSLTSTR